MQFVNRNYSYVSHESFGDALRFSFSVSFACDRLARYIEFIDIQLQFYWGSLSTTWILPIVVSKFMDLVCYRSSRFNFKGSFIVTTDWKDVFLISRVTQKLKLIFIFILPKRPTQWHIPFYLYFGCKCHYLCWFQWASCPTSTLFYLWLT